jgi:hypothetical protein
MLCVGLGGSRREREYLPSRRNTRFNWIIAVIYTLGVFEGKRAGVVVGSGRMVVLEGRVELRSSGQRMGQ